MKKPRKTRSGSSGGNVRFENKHLVLVEGADDQAVISSLIVLDGLEDFQVHDMNGKDQWQRKVSVISKAPEFTENVVALGLVKDADSDPKGAWDSCRFALSRAGLPVPSGPVVASSGNPRTAVLIVPSKDANGAIEELCLESFDKYRMGCVEKYFDCLATRYTETNRIGKGLIQAYLAGLQEPVRDLTLAVAKGEIDLTHTCFDDARSFLKNLVSTNLLLYFHALARCNTLTDSLHQCGTWRGQHQFAKDVLPGRKRDLCGNQRSGTAGVWPLYSPSPTP